MTTDGKRHISFLLILCFSVFLGHSLVPHHHHHEVTDVEMNGECGTNHEDHHADETPTHCHAFNSLRFVTYSYSEIQQPVRIIPIDLVPVSRIELKQPKESDFKRVTCLIIGDKKTKYIGSISMRAPPVSA